MTTTAERAKEIMTWLRRECSDAICTHLDCPSCGCMAYITQALHQAQNDAEQRAIDRCRQIISTAIAGDNADAESMRRLLLAAFDPRWDRVASIINPKD